MNYWWVNQNQTFRQERNGGYLWSPKRKADNRINPFYEYMKVVAPGDIIFSFVDTYIRAIGIAKTYCYECPKPEEFGGAGPNWNNIGWKVEVHYIDLLHQIRPSEYMELIRPVLPQKYSPLQQNGRGHQGIYLTNVSEPLQNVLVNLIGQEARDIINMNYISEEFYIHNLSILEWEEHLRDELSKDTSLSETEKKQLILARRGQGQFKKNVQALESYCRITKVDEIEHLRASHCKPWRDCIQSEERLDGENGLLLTPSIDHLFDRGFISFENNGRLLISDSVNRDSIRKMGVPVDEPLNTGAFSDGQKMYLDYHRDNVFLHAMITN